MKKDINQKSLNTRGGEGVVVTKGTVPSHASTVAWVEEMIKASKRNLASEPNSEFYQAQLNTFKTVLSKLTGEF